MVLYSDTTEISLPILIPRPRPRSYLRLTRVFQKSGIGMYPFIKNYMQNKPAMRGGNYDTLFFLWNMFLSVSSGLGAVLLFPILYEEVTTNDNYGMCNNPHINNPIFIYVCILFNFSKFLEFIDTVFVVTRKSHLEFIHWYHHITTCLYCWHSSYIVTSSGKFFVLIKL